MKIWSLMENTSACEDLHAEHGLSLYIETGGHKILFDTGKSGDFADNARIMGIDLAGVELAVLSHGHFDHGGGIRRFLQENDHAPVYLSSHAFEAHFGAERRYIGLDPDLQGSSRLVAVEDYRRLDEGLELFSCAGKPLVRPIDSAGLFVEQDGVCLPEDFRHEQYLLIREGEKRVLISGCSHRGILNIMQWFAPDVLIGGFHFMNLDPEGEGRETLEEAAARLSQYPTQYYTCHCTGLAPYAFLKQRMGEQLHYLATGDQLEV